MWSDNETVDDILGFTHYVETLKQIVLNTDLSPVSIGVYGDWGAGKSSLMKMLEKSLIAERTEQNEIITIWFNPWIYENKEEVQSALILSILSAIRKKSSITDELKQTWNRLKKCANVIKLAKNIAKTVVTFTPDIPGFFDAFSDDAEAPEANMSAFKADFAELLEQIKIKSLVVFIDDLDRCDGQRALELLETVFLFLSTQRTAFVIGVDPKMINNAIEIRYRDSREDARQYLEKLIQLPFNIPAQRLNDIEIYLICLIVANSLKPGFKPKFIKHLKDKTNANQNLSTHAEQWLSDNPTGLTRPLVQLKEELQSLIPHVKTIKTGLKGNPRQIKRFFNIFKMRQTLAKENDLTIDTAILTKFLVLQYAWDRENVLEFISSSYDHDKGRSLGLDTLYSNYENPAENDSTLLSIEKLLAIHGLQDFLMQPPRLDEVDDISPYLFLSQTKLGADIQVSTACSEQELQELVDKLLSGDRIKVSIACSTAIQRDEQTIHSIASRCISQLSSPDTQIVENALYGAFSLCTKNPLTMNHLSMLIHKLEKNTKSINAKATTKEMATKILQELLTLRKNMLDTELIERISTVLETFKNPSNDNINAKNS